jgi:SAM-dependent methyltransferase
MLAYARENAPGVHFLADDARSFAIDTTFDAIVCVFDSLNHIMSLKELGDVFKSVYRALKDNGVFHFDMNLEAEYTDHWSGVHGIVEDEQVCVIRLNYDAETRTGVFDATLFLLAEGWRRTDFVLKQKWYPESDINKELEKAGFKTVEIYNFDQEKNLTELSPEARRAFFRCIK